MGFLADFILFLLPAALWDTLTGSITGTKVFQFIYFFSSFWNQFGPNCTTFLVAGRSLLCMLCLLCFSLASTLALMCSSPFWNQFDPNCTTFFVAGRPLLCLLCVLCIVCFELAFIGAAVSQCVCFVFCCWNAFGPNCTTFRMPGRCLLCMLCFKLVTLVPNVFDFVSYVAL